MRVAGVLLDEESEAQGHYRGLDIVLLWGPGGAVSYEWGTPVRFKHQAAEGWRKVKKPTS